jgi:hypothetical protein
VQDSTTQAHPTRFQVRKPVEPSLPMPIAPTSSLCFRCLHRGLCCQVLWLQPDAAICCFRNLVVNPTPGGSHAGRANAAASGPSCSVSPQARQPPECLTPLHAAVLGLRDFSLTASPKLAHDDKKTLWPTRQRSTRQPVRQCSKGFRSCRSLDSLFSKTHLSM